MLGALLVGLLAGCAGPPAPDPSAVTPAAVAVDATVVVPGPVQQVDRLAPSRPVSLTVPAIGVRAATLTGLGRDAGGALEMPPAAATAGWSMVGPTPGSDGPAVITAHIAHGPEPGVFARLAELVPGDQVGVHRADGLEAVFVAYRVQRFPATAFPVAEIYAATPGPELRLITWGGVFDRGTGRFADNVVVFARLAGVR